MTILNLRVPQSNIYDLEHLVSFKLIWNELYNNLWKKKLSSFSSLNRTYSNIISHVVANKMSIAYNKYYLRVPQSNIYDNIISQGATEQYI
jgi:hypothetical protein